MNKAIDILNALISLMLKEWPSFEEYTDYYLKKYLPKLKNNGEESNKNEKILIKLIKAVATSRDWDNLSKIIFDTYKKKNVSNYTLSDIYKFLSKKIDFQFVNNNPSDGYELYERYLGLIPSQYFGPATKAAQQKRNREILAEIESFLKVYDFQAAEKLYSKIKTTTKQSEYKKLIEKYIEKLVNLKLKEIQSCFQNNNFHKAHFIYSKWKDYFPKKVFDRERKKYTYEALKKIEPDLKVFNFSKADRETKNIFGHIVEEYKDIKSRYIYRFLIKNDDLHFGKGQYTELADVLVEFSDELNNTFTHINIKDFFLTSLKYPILPYILNRYLITSLIDNPENNINNYNNRSLSARIEQFLKQSMRKSEKSDLVWNIFLKSPNLLKDIVNNNNEIHDALSYSFPFEKATQFENIFFPSEKLILEKILNKKDRDDIPINANTKGIFEKKKYNNALMLIMILEAYSKEKVIEYKDIFKLFKIMIIKMFDYHSAEKSQVRNLIFPKCISVQGAKKFKIDDNDRIFCEGNIWSAKKIVMCRNRKCDERTKEVKNDSYLSEAPIFDFLKHQISIDVEKIKESPELSMMMSSMNRWNEICDRVVCGYNGTKGCNSPLIFSSTNLQQIGFSVFATTYWRCSNEECEQKEHEIKLSHCKGCGKIIDSRFDRIKCPRTDDRSFYICMDCGYCCQQHEVSGHCPVCNHTEWDNIDEYGKQFRCRKCNHKIIVPGKLKKNLNKKFSLEKMNSKGKKHP